MRQFGNATVFRKVREMWSLTWLENLSQDARFAPASTAAVTRIHAGNGSDACTRYRREYSDLYTDECALAAEPSRGRSGEDGAHRPLDLA